MLTVLRRKKVKRTVVFVSVFAVLIATVFVFYKIPKGARAGVGISGSDVFITGGRFAIDNDGKIYQDQRYDIVEGDGSTHSGLVAVPREHYSYLFADTGKTVSSSSNLTISESAIVTMEGTQNFNNLTIKGIVNQPYPDREGRLNKPIYTKDNWAIKLTGYFKLEANSRYYLYSSALDDAVSVEIGTKNSTWADKIDSETSWVRVYGNRTSSSSNGWAKKNTTLADFVSDTGSQKYLQNSSSVDRYIPIRLTYGEFGGETYIRLNAKKYASSDTGYLAAQSDSVVATSSFCGLNSDKSGSIAASSVTSTCGKSSVLSLDYYIVKDAQIIQGDFSNAVRTAGKYDFSLNSGFTDGYGDVSSASTLDYYWDNNGTPYGWTYGEFNGVRSSRYSNVPFNNKADDSTRRIAAGLTINVANNMVIENGGKIDLTGFGYPGYANEMTNDDNLTGSTRGGSLSTDGTPGGGYSNAMSGHSDNPAGTGGSHGGKGGVFTYYNTGMEGQQRPDTYGNELDPFTLGSGGGAGTDYRWTNISGSGGGALKIIAKNLSIKSNSYIMADGSWGKYSGDYNNTIAGGAGGSVNLTINGQLQIDRWTTDPIISARGGAGEHQLNNIYSRMLYLVGGGGGRIKVAYANSNVDRSTLETAVLSADGANAGNISEFPGQTEDLVDGTKGTVRTEFVTASGESISITKQTFNKDGEREATFEAGDQVTVELRVYEPGSSDRDDFKIEDNVPISSGTIKVTLKKSDGSQVSKNISVSSNKIILEGDSGAGIVLKSGENIITYSYTL